MSSSEALTAEPTRHVKRVYYDASGTITGWDINNGLVRQGVNHIVIVNEHFDLNIDPTTHKVANGTLVELSEEEKKIANRPTLHEIRCQRAAELRDTDWRERFPDWADYRQTLRDITTHGDAVAMVNAWPARPDGTDSIPHFRVRI